MNLRDIVKELIKDEEEKYSIIGTVSKINSDNTIDVSPLDGKADILGVRLIADDSLNGFILTPVINSNVIVSFLSKEEGYVSVFSKVDFYSIKNDKEDLKKLMQDLITQINALVDATAQITVIASSFGSPTTPPANIIAIEEVKVQTQLINERLDLLFK